MFVCLIPWALCLFACGSGTPAAPAPVPPIVAPAPADQVPPPLPTPTEDRYAASHVLISWAGAAGAADGVTRTEAQAEAIASDLHARAVGGAALETLAREHSDSPSGARGGAIGVYRTGTMMPDFEAAVASVEVGSIAPLVRTPFGYHVVRRDPVVQVELRHILVPFAGAWRSTATRTEAQARARAEQARAAVEAGQAFGEVAREFSEDATAQVGGDLGVVVPGQLVPDFEEAAMALQVGDLSEPVRTPYGYHIIERTR